MAITGAGADVVLWWETESWTVTVTFQLPAAEGAHVVLFDVDVAHPIGSPAQVNAQFEDAPDPPETFATKVTFIPRSNTVLPGSMFTFRAG